MEFEYEGFFWWAIPQKLAGMAQPESLELKLIHELGIRTVISLLNKPLVESFYVDAGFNYLSSPIQDGHPPSLKQAKEIVDFIGESLRRNQPVAVHCVAGWGRTGTILACYLISEGKSPREAIDSIRSSQKNSIETEKQEKFLFDFETYLQKGVA